MHEHAFSYTAYTLQDIAGIRASITYTMYVVLLTYIYMYIRASGLKQGKINPYIRITWANFSPVGHVGHQVGLRTPD